MADVVFELFETVRSAVKMAYAALGVSNLNAQKIVEFEGRLKKMEMHIDDLLVEYEQAKRQVHGRATAAGIWRAKAMKLKAELDHLSSEI